MPAQVTLVKLPNSPVFIGSFDLSNWWKSNPLPGSVSYIIANCWVYGSSHACIVKMTNGNHAAYVSRNYGKDWIKVFETGNQLLFIDRVDYGRAFISASNGWYETQTSGESWQFISSGAPGCKAWINMPGDAIFAHNGSKVYRSYDFGRNWTLVLDKNNMTIHCFHDGSSYWVNWAGDSYPAIGGGNGMVVVGMGPYLVASTDWGQQWNEPWAWKGGRTELLPNEPPLTRQRLLQIIRTDSWGPAPDQSAYMMRDWHIDYGRTRYIYSPNIWTSTVNAKFDQPYAGVDERGIPNNQLVAYDVLRPGSTFVDRMVFMCQSGYVKKSSDGGQSWVTLPVADFKVYSGDPGQQTFTFGGAFLDDNYTKWSWIGDPCHNSGYYTVTGGKYVRNISWDMDYILRFPHKNFTYQMDYSTNLRKTLPSELDMLLSKAFEKSLIADTFLKGAINLPHTPDVWLRKEIETPGPIDVIVVIRKYWSWDMDIDMKFTKNKLIDFSGYVKGSRTKQYSIGMVLVESHLDEILVDMESRMPQCYESPFSSVPHIDQRTKALDFDIFDSRKAKAETEEE